MNEDSRKLHNGTRVLLPIHVQSVGNKHKLPCRMLVHSPEFPSLQDRTEGGGNAVAQWLRCCATNGKVAGSIPDGVIGIFHLHKILPIAL